MFDYLFFDLDGTLTDPALGITNSFKYALKFFGREIPSYVVRPASTARHEIFAFLSILNVRIPMTGMS